MIYLLCGRMTFIHSFCYHSSYIRYPYFGIIVRVSFGGKSSLDSESTVHKLIVSGPGLV